MKTEKRETRVYKNSKPPIRVFPRSSSRRRVRVVYVVAPTTQQRVELISWASHVKVAVTPGRPKYHAERYERYQVGQVQHAPGNLVTPYRRKRRVDNQHQNWKREKPNAKYQAKNAVQMPPITVRFDTRRSLKIPYEPHQQDNAPDHDDHARRRRVTIER